MNPHTPFHDGHRRRLLGGAAALSMGLPLLGCAGGGETADNDPLRSLPVRIDTSTDPSHGVFFGLFREAALTDVVVEGQADYRMKPAAAMWFTRFGAPFPESAVRYLAQQGIAAQITWEPWGDRDQAIPLADIAAGK